ncbi:MAG: hypothetical protein ACRDFB_07170 [Rhabdochlamydiaceae bacterium]
MRIYAGNPIIDNNPSNNLSASVLAGSTTLDIYSNYGFSSTTNIFLVGIYGDLQAELVYSTATDSTSATIYPATTYPHPQDTSLILMTYDEIEFSRSDDGGITWNVLGTIAIQVDKKSTVYIDTAASTISQWKFRFKNSVISVYSNYSTSLTQSGYLPYQLEYIQDGIVQDFPDPNMKFLTYSNITRWANGCSNDMALGVAMADKQGLTGYVSKTFSSNSNTLTLEDDFMMLKRLSISYDNGTSYNKASPIPLNNSSLEGKESTAFNQFNNKQPVYTRLGNTVMVLPGSSTQPYPTNYNLWYYRLPTYMVNSQDSLDLIFRPFTQVYNDYIMWRAKLSDKKYKEAKDFYQSYLVGKANFLEGMTQWQLDQNDSIDTDDFDYVMGWQRQPGTL